MRYDQREGLLKCPHSKPMGIQSSKVRLWIGTGNKSCEWFLVSHSPLLPFFLKIFQQVKEKHFAVARG